MSDGAVNSDHPCTPEFAHGPAVIPAPPAVPILPLAPIKISFLTDGTAERAYWIHFLKSLHGLRATIRREKLAGVVASSGLAAVVGTSFAAIVASDGRDNLRFSPIAGVLVAIPCLLYGLNGGAWSKWRRDMRALIDGLSVGAHQARSVTVSVLPDGYTAEFADRSRTIKWSGISQIVRFDRWIVICHADGRDADPIPASAFASNADADMWFLHASGLVESSGNGPDARARVAIDQGPVRCGKCGYNLVGVRIAKCPECGIRLSEPQIRLWRQLQMPLYKHVRAVLGFRR